MAAPDPLSASNTTQARHEVAIVGAGIAGCAAASCLHALHKSVIVFDRGRRAGGRASANQADFDYGVPAFAADSPAFLERVRQWKQAGLIVQWQPSAKRWTTPCNSVDELPDAQLPSQWVATKSLASLFTTELAQIQCEQNALVQRIEFSGGHWALYDAADHCIGRANQLLLAMPIEQARRLLDESIQESALPIDRPTQPMSVPQWVSMLEFEEPVSNTTDTIDFGDHPVLSAAWSESRKPGGAASKWIVHSQPEWALTRLSIERDTIAELMFAAFKQAVGRCPRIMSHRAHRWTFSRTRTALGCGPIHHPHPPVTLCGDWSVDGTFQGAWLSGLEAAEKLGNQA
ncbi:MAG: NAD(P)/FAD-dependent oxidoreductase [Burkholderiaceae bacterium]